jgi:hypothetical protein
MLISTEYSLTSKMFRKSVYCKEVQCVVVGRSGVEELIASFTGTTKDAVADNTNGIFCELQNRKTRVSLTIKHTSGK